MLRGGPKKDSRIGYFPLFWNLKESQIRALYKVSLWKFFLVFGSKAAKEKLQGTEIQCRFRDSQIGLNFRKPIGPLRNWREPIFVTILLPEFISDQAGRLALSNVGEGVSVFIGRHKFNRSIRNGKRIFPAGGFSVILPRKFSFHGNIQRDVYFAGKGGVVLQEQNSSHAWRKLSCYHTH